MDKKEELIITNPTFGQVLIIKSHIWASFTPHLGKF